MYNLSLHNAADKSVPDHKSLQYTMPKSVQLSDAKFQDNIYASRIYKSQNMTDFHDNEYSKFGTQNLTLKQKNPDLYDTEPFGIDHIKSNSILGEVDNQSAQKKSYQFKSHISHNCNEHKIFGDSEIFETKVFNEQDLLVYKKQNMVNSEQHNFNTRDMYSKGENDQIGQNLDKSQFYGSKLHEDSESNIDHKMYPLKRMNKDYNEFDDSCIRQGKYPVYESGVQLGRLPTDVSNRSGNAQDSRGNIEAGGPVKVKPIRYGGNRLPENKAKLSKNALLEPIACTRCHNDYITCTAVSANEANFYTVSADKRLKEWNLEDMSQVCTYDQVHTETIRWVSLAKANDFAYTVYKILL